MATAQQKRFHFAMRCNSCGKDHDTNWYCRQCKDTLCVTCREHHSTHFNNHVIITRHTVTQEHIANLKKKPILCKWHGTETCQLYCLPCDCAVCTKCVVESHRKHEFANFSEMVSRKRAEFERVMKEFQEQRVPEYNKISQNLSKRLALYTKDIESVCCDIRSQVSAISAAAEILGEKYVQTMQSQKDTSILPWEKCISKRLQDMNSIFHEIELFEQALNSERTLDLPFMMQRLKGKIYELRNSAFPISPLAAFNYEKSEVKDDSLQQLFGQMKTENSDYEDFLKQATQKKMYSRQSVLPKVRQLPPPKTEVTVLKTIDVTQKVGKAHERVLVLVLNEKEICISSKQYLFVARKDGIIMRTIPKTEKFVDPIAMLPNEVFIARDIHRMHFLNKILPNGKMEPYKSFDFGQLNGLFVNKKQELIATLAYDEDTYGEIVRMDRSRNITQRVYNDQSDTYIFANPTSITENGNNDICIVDVESNTVEAITEDGRHKFSYGNSEILKNFSPQTVVCDGNMNFLVSDSGNNNIHVLDREGKILRYLQTYDHVIRPYGLSVEKEGQLWVSDYHLTKIYLIQYF